MPETLRKFSSVDNDWMLLGTIHGETRLFKVAYIFEINQGVIEVCKKMYCFSKVRANRETKTNDTQIKNEGMR